MKPKFKSQDIIIYESFNNDKSIYETWICYIIFSDTKYYTISKVYNNRFEEKYDRASKHISFNSPIDMKGKLIKEEATEEDYYKFVENYIANYIFK